MKRRPILTGLYAMFVLALISCAGQSIPQSHSNAGANANALRQGRGKPDASSCYSGDTGTPATVSATVTYYGWPDNSPPGAAIAHPVIHATAGGVGSYCDPTTFATEPTSAENKEIPYGTRIYVPAVQKYFIREDDCTTSGPQGLGCSGVWTDLWIGGDAKSNSNSVIDCEDALTANGKIDIILHPSSSETVAWTGPIYSDSLGCNKGGTAPTPTPAASATPTAAPTATPTAAPTAKPTASPTAGPTPSGSTADVVWYDYFQDGDGCGIAHPVIHSCAGGTGTYANPITFAAPVSDDSSIPYGTIVYLPSLQRYFIREDDCSSSDCTNAGTLKLWIGGNDSDVRRDMASCEKYLTTHDLKNPDTPIAFEPPSNETVSSLGQIWNEAKGTCDGSSNY